MILEEQLRAEDLFKGLQKESETSNRSLEVGASTLEGLINSARIFYTLVKKGYSINDLNHSIGELISSTSHIFENMKYSSGTITQLPIYLKKFEQEKGFEYLGYFLSLLTNNSDETNFNICLNYLENRLIGLGYKNKEKNIVFHGDVEGLFCHKMESGIIELKGNCFGDIGTEMEGGKIYVFGDIHIGISSIGHRMLGGEIHIGGEYDAIIPDRTYGGNIYHKGKLIVKDGRRIQ